MFGSGKEKKQYTGVVYTKITGNIHDSRAVSFVLLLWFNFFDYSNYYYYQI